MDSWSNILIYFKVLNWHVMTFCFSNSTSIWVLIDSYYNQADFSCLLYIFIHYYYYFYVYRNDPKFSDRYAWANSAHPDQTAPRGAV